METPTKNPKASRRSIVVMAVLGAVTATGASPFEDKVLMVALAAIYMLTDCIKHWRNA